MKQYKHIQSQVVYGKLFGDAYTGAIATPIYQTATYMLGTLGANKGYEYSRSGNPTRAALEQLIAGLENGVAGFAFASGMAAITAVMSLFQSGDKIVFSGNVYGGTYRLLVTVFERFGIGCILTDTSDMEQLEAALTPDVKVVWIETPSNPLLMITDIEACAEIAHRHGSLLLVDNTFMTPYYQRPLDLGADLVIHSATKYLGGHSDLIAGLVACKTAEYAEKVLAIQNSTGGISQPMDCYLLIRSIKTLALRMERHTENAMTVANALSTHPKIRAVYYPGLPGSDGYEIHKKQASGAGGMLSFELADGGKPRLLFDALKMISLAESLGGVESLICHPATMTHAALTPEMQKSVGITEELIRLSVGIEHIDDILGDLLPAIDAAFV